MTAWIVYVLVLAAVFGSGAALIGRSERRERRRLKHTRVRVHLGRAPR